MVRIYIPYPHHVHRIVPINSIDVGSDHNGDLRLHRPSVNALLRVILWVRLSHVQVSAAIRIHQRLPIRGLHVV